MTVMSASTERKNRQAAREAGTDKKQLAQEKAAQEQAKSRRRWTIGTIAVVVVIALVLLLNSPLVYKSAAYTVGDRKYSTAEVSYRYANQYLTFANQYGNYASMFGLDTSAGIQGLDKQDCPFNGGSWKDYFLEAAKNEMQQTTALLDYAAQNGITLDESELAEVETAFEGLDERAKSYGYANADKMMAANYGAGVNVALVRSAMQESALANKAMEALQESFSYTEQDLEERYQSYAGMRDYFDYSYVTVEAHGDEDSEPTEESKAEAMKTAEAVRAAYAAAKGDDYAQRLSDAAEAQGLSANRGRSTIGSGLVAAGEWMMDAARKAGDVTVEADADGDHVYVVLFISRNDNHYYRPSVRHILIKAEADENGVYTDEAKAAAKARAEEILAEFNAGDKSEDSFATLANLYSEDTGSNTNGGLYENIVKGTMVEEFDAFCFAGHKPGDTGIVYGESATYAGYHVMYYVGEGEELYSSSIAKDDLRSTAVSEKLEELTAAYTVSEGFGMKFVG